MSQISPPMRILFGGAIVFLAVWFTLLRPKADAPAPVATTTTTTAPTGNVNTGKPAESGAGKIVEKAKSAATTAEGAAKAAAGETTAKTTTTPQTAAGSATTTAPGAKAEPGTTIPAATLAKLPKDVAGALEGHKVLVLAVLTDKATRWRPMADDDRYVRNTLKKVNRYDGDVLVKQIPLDKLVTYAPLVNDLQVNQTPSIVVVDGKLKANVLAGFVDRVSINQAIADARSAGTDQLITDSYLKQANAVCANAKVSLGRWSLPTIRGKKALVKSARRARAGYRDYVAAIKRLPATAKWRGLKRQWLSVANADSKTYDKLVTATKHSDLATLSALAGADATKAQLKLDHRFDTTGLTSCSALRRQ